VEAAGQRAAEEDFVEIAIRTILWVHVLAGTLALVVAPIALLTAKGGLAHRRWGKVYFWSMAVVGPPPSWSATDGPSSS
jgi:uncharacterized membrane protein